MLEQPWWWQRALACAVLPPSGLWCGSGRPWMPRDQGVSTVMVMTLLRRRAY